MSKMAEFTTFDSTDYLSDYDSLVEYLRLSLEEDDDEMLEHSTQIVIDSVVKHGLDLHTLITRFDQSLQPDSSRRQGGSSFLHALVKSGVKFLTPKHS